MQTKPTYTNLFPNSARSIRIDGKIADYSGEGSISAIRREDGGFILQSSAIGSYDERLFGSGVIIPTSNKTNPKAPDFRGWIVLAEDETKWLVAAWWRLTRDNSRYLSLALTAAGSNQPKQEQKQVQRQEAMLHTAAAPSQADMFSDRGKPSPVAPSQAKISAEDTLLQLLRRFIERAECANCAEDWAAVVSLASEAREMLNLAA